MFMFMFSQLIIAQLKKYIPNIHESIMKKNNIK